MSVFFLYPVFLLGLLAASLPVLIHLLNRRKLKRIRFPAVRFILLSQKRISRSYRLRHWILLALRTLAVVFLALLLANPIFQTGAGLFAGGGPVSLVVLLDNSLSMTWSGDGNGFKQAKDAARLLISALNDDDRAAIVPTNITGKEPFRLKAQKDVLLRELDAIEIADGTVNLEAALGKAYELLNVPAGQKEIRFITDMGLTGWDQFSLAGLKQVDPSIPLKLIHVGRKQTPPNGSIKEIRLGSPGIGANLPLQIDVTVANFGESELKDVLAQLSIDGQNKEQKLISVPGKSESSLRFQTRLSQPGAHAGQVTLKKAGLAGNPTTNFTLDAQEKLKVLVVDGDPQTSVVQSETFFLSRALNPSGERDASIFLPTVILTDGLNTATLDGYQVLILCNVAALPESFTAKLQSFLRQGGGVLIFAGDKFQADSYNQKIARDLPGQLGEKKLGPEANADKIGKFAAKHPALQFLADPILEESIKSARVWGYFRTTAGGQAPLITLANGDALLLEQNVGAGRILMMTSSADRDWTDLPLKTVYLPLIQSLAQYLAGGNRGALDGGIAVGAAKEIALPPTLVGKNLRVTKPDKQTAEVAITAEKNRAVASIEENDRAGIYRVSLPVGGEKNAGAPQMYAVNPPLLESRLDEISARELQAKLSPIRAEVIPVDALKEGGKRTDLALPLLALLIVTLLIEGWLGQRF
ncbi:MAG: VWA domain-containing protein [Deltaproteobacteria bacterium]|nr:MAG: VWA domain-containing protein [Deltaproteobacteria bacterium]